MMIVFHGTTLTAYKKIIKNNTLIPHKSTGGTSLLKKGVKKPPRGFVYVTDDYDTAEWYARGVLHSFPEGVAPVVIEIDVPESILSPDPLEKDCYRIKGQLRLDDFRWIGHL